MSLRSVSVDPVAETMYPGGGPKPLHSPPSLFLLHFLPLLIFPRSVSFERANWPFSWKFLEMQDAAAQEGLPPPDEGQAREHCLRPEIEAPDLASTKDFMRFYASTSERFELVDDLTLRTEQAIIGHIPPGFTHLVTRSDVEFIGMLYVSQPMPKVALMFKQLIIDLLIMAAIRWTTIPRCTSTVKRSRLITSLRTLSTTLVLAKATLLRTSPRQAHTTHYRPLHCYIVN